MRILSNVARGYFRCKIYAYYSLLADPLSCLLIIDYWVSLNVRNSKLSRKNRRKREIKKKKEHNFFTVPFYPNYKIHFLICPRVISSPYAAIITRATNISTKTPNLKLIFPPDSSNSIQNNIHQRKIFLVARINGEYFPKAPIQQKKKINK